MSRRARTASRCLSLRPAAFAAVSRFAGRGSDMLKSIAILSLVTAIVVGAFCPLAATAQTPPDAMPSLIVKLVAGLTAEQQADVIARNGGIEVSTVAALRLHVIAVPTSDLDAVLASYQAHPQVVRAEVNKVRRSETAPTDPLYPNQRYLPQINWDLVFGSVTPTGSSTVAILDTGIDASHPDLASYVSAGTSILDGTDGLNDPKGHGAWMPRRPTRSYVKALPVSHMPASP
jgi:hypothetical protein